MSKEEQLAKRIAGLEADEREILEAMLDRLEKGRQTYGPWLVNDGRNYRSEAFSEVIDALHYCAAGLLQLSRCPACGRKHTEKVCA